MKDGGDFFARERVSRLGLGVWTTFGERVDFARAKRIFRAARDFGLNHFDAAADYADGRGESFLGRLANDECFLSTKIAAPAKSGGSGARRGIRGRCGVVAFAPRAAGSFVLPHADRCGFAAFAGDFRSSDSRRQNRALGREQLAAANVARGAGRLSRRADSPRPRRRKRRAIFCLRRRFFRFAIWRRKTKSRWSVIRRLRAAFWRGDICEAFRADRGLRIRGKRATSAAARRKKRLRARWQKSPPKRKCRLRG